MTITERRAEFVYNAARLAAEAAGAPIIPVLWAEREDAFRSQFLNVIESVFSGMAKAVIHNSNFPSVEAAQSVIDGYIAERNDHFAKDPKRAGLKIWGGERVPSEFAVSHNCKDPRYR